MKKKLGIGCLSIIGILFLLTVIGYLKYNESLPESESGPEAEALAAKMLARVDKPAWDSLNYISWTFVNSHHFAWDKRANHAIISWDKNEVLMDLDEVTGKAYIDGKEVTGDSAQNLTSTAWSHWCNDSFWLAAPYKIKDPGTKRSIVNTDDGNKALMITYEGGGVTPGDSYLWLLDDTGLPYAYKMWVSILPLGGIKAEWKDWQKLPGGAMIAENHPLSPVPMNVTITNLKAGQKISDLDLDNNAFNL